MRQKPGDSKNCDELKADNQRGTAGVCFRQIRRKQINRRGVEIKTPLGFRLYARTLDQFGSSERLRIQIDQRVVVSGKAEAIRAFPRDCD